MSKIERHGGRLFDFRTGKAYIVRNSNARPKMQAVAVTATPTSPMASTGGLVAELKSWWIQESQDWDSLVSEAGPSPPGSSDDLWDGMPVIDSKVVARSSPIFEKHLGLKLDVKLVRPGGYSSIDDLVSDLVPKMRLLATESSKSGGTKE